MFVPDLPGSWAMVPSAPNRYSSTVSDFSPEPINTKVPVSPRVLLSIQWGGAERLKPLVQEIARDHRRLGDITGRRCAVKKTDMEPPVLNGFAVRIIHAQMNIADDRNPVGGRSIRHTVKGHVRRTLRGSLRNADTRQRDAAALRIETASANGRTIFIFVPPIPEDPKRRRTSGVTRLLLRMRTQVMVDPVLRVGTDIIEEERIIIRVVHAGGPTGQGILGRVNRLAYDHTARGVHLG